MLDIDKYPNIYRRNSRTKNFELLNDHVVCSSEARTK